MDGLARGDKSRSVMQRVAMKAFVPLHLSALQRSSELCPWLTAAAKGLDPIFLEPEDWFTKGQGLGTLIWHPAPAAPDVVVEQLGKARHMQPSSLHLVVVPRLMTGRWQCHMTRECDCYFRIPPGCTLWGKTHEPTALIFICLPFVVHRPNLSAKSKLLEDFRGAMLQEQDLWKASDERGGDCFAQFFTASQVLLRLVTIVGVEVALHPRISSLSQVRHQLTMMVWINGWLAMSCAFWRVGMETT
jgi:hypothetical protein